MEKVKCGHCKFLCSFWKMLTAFFKVPTENNGFIGNKSEKRFLVTENS